MEYTLTIRQVAIHKYFPTLDIKDAAILDFLGRFAHSKAIEKKLVGQTIFFWFDYKKISTENPLLRLNYEAMRKRMSNLCKLGILEPHPANKGGKVFFAFGLNHEKTHRAENPEAYEAAKERAEIAEVGMKIPRLKKEVGISVPMGRYENTEVLPKGRYENTYNQYNQSYQPTIISEEAKNEKNAVAVKPQKPLFKASLDTSPPIPAHPPALGASRAADFGAFKSFDLDAEFEALKTDPFLKEAFVRNDRIPVEKFEEYTTLFPTWSRGNGKSYNNRADLRGHFHGWARGHWKGEQAERAKTPLATTDSLKRKSGAVESAPATFF